MFAAENDTCGIPFDQRGIQQSLEVAAEWADQLIDEIETREREANRKSEVAI